MISWVAAMAGLDYENATKLWDKESISLMSGLNRAQNKDAGYWIESWRQSFSGRKLSLKNKITYGQYVLIEYELLGQQGLPEFSEAVAVRQQDGFWYLTLDLADSPVVNGWEKLMSVSEKSMMARWAIVSPEYLKVRLQLLVRQKRIRDAYH